MTVGSESNSNKDHKINGQQKLSKNDLNTVETFWNIINDKAASDLSRLGSNNNNNSHSGAVRGNDISTTDESKMFDVIQKSSFYGIRDTRKLSVQSDTLTVTAAQSNLVSPLSPPVSLSLFPKLLMFDLLFLINFSFACVCVCACEIRRHSTARPLMKIWIQTLSNRSTLCCK
jgi:hypothetical protein